MSTGIYSGLFANLWVLLKILPSEDQNRKRVGIVFSTGDINRRKFPVVTILVFQEREGGLLGTPIKL